MPTLDRQTRQLITAARTLGNAPRPIFLEDTELLRLCAIVVGDLERGDLVRALLGEEAVPADYYAIAPAWFRQAITTGITLADGFTLLQGEIADFATYFRSLCELHKRRLKFEQILEYQPIRVSKQWFHGA